MKNTPKLAVGFKLTGGAGAHQSRAGFTLVEILIVMVIVGILATIGFGSFQTSQLKSRDASRKSDLKQIGNALETYYNDHGQYPTDTGGLINGCNGGQPCDWGEALVDDKGSVYMIKLPSDPQKDRTYYYSAPTGDSYQIYASLENELDKDLPLVAGSPAEYDGLLCGSDRACNYGTASPNTTPNEGRSLVAM